MARRAQSFTWLGLVGLGMTVGCMSDPAAEDIASNAPAISWEEFRDATPRETWPGGMYIVEGDIGLDDEKALREYYDAQYPQQGALIVHRNGNADAKWDATQKRNLTYCVSNAFGANKVKVIAALAQATDQGWELAADVNFIHLSAQDSSCNANNTDVLFDVMPVSGQGYLARAFYPGESRAHRNLLIDSAAFQANGIPLKGLLGHELGHVLGFRHEHTRPEAGNCFEDNDWRALTPYDQQSIMIFPQCVGSTMLPTMSTLDKAGAASLYGPPGNPGDPPPPPPPPPNMTDTVSGTLAHSQQQLYPAVSVVPGSLFKAVTTGTGDADLYVRFGAPPTLTVYDCRSQSATSQEQCILSAGGTTAHVMVRGFSAASYTLTRTWAAP